MTKKYYSDYPKRDFPLERVINDLKTYYDFEPDTIYETPTGWLVYNPYTKANKEVDRLPAREEQAG